MGSLASAAFHALFSWVRSVFRVLWRVLFQNGGSTDEFSSLSHNWLVWVLVLCAACTLIDVVVYLFRWRPYRVWASWFRRLRGEGTEAETLEPSVQNDTDDFLEDEDVSGLLYEDQLNAEPESYALPGYPDMEGGIIPEEKSEGDIQPQKRGLLRRMADKTREIAGTGGSDPDLSVRFKPEPMPVKPE